jgi:alanyl-tRNA synthetase
MNTDDLRKTFLDFFASKGHKIFPSDSLVPQDDPTVLFTAAGMNQFKPQFLGRISDFRRAASCQKCLRTDDLDKVGKTPGHHTFFEMLGNFSFGDYFKEEAIALAWELVTDILKIFPEKLWVSVYEDDEEAYAIWSNKIKMPKGKILRLGQKENFWPSNVVSNGPNGPCGPCSEIFFDQGRNVGCKRAECSPLCDCGRFVEVWNLVFTQFERRQDSNGKAYLQPLPQKNIDTGMGLERMAAVLQGVLTNFEIDIFKPIVEEISRQPQTANRKPLTATYAIADHIRAVVFAIADGVLPSNEERGYVVRKLIRKAAWHGRSGGLEDKFLYKIVPIVTKVMQVSYPELNQRRENISQIVLVEEERFQNTLEDGLNILNNLIGGLKENKIKQINGEEAFKLYDTFGFPLELTEMIAREKGFNVDKVGFMVKMDEQRRKSKEKSQIAQEIFVIKDKLKINVSSKFVGYDKLENQTKIRLINKNEQIVEEANTNEQVEIILEETPFYPEGGGQVGDSGIIEAMEGEDKRVEINDVKKIESFIIHKGKVVKGRIKTGDNVLAKVDKERRLDIARNHTATHLLQSALREVLGTHVEQSGSWVGAEGLRFDFTHFKAITEEQLERIEELVNVYIRNDDRLNSEITDIASARKKGALAFFGEKYEEKVRLVSIGGYSKELCAGTHLKSTGEIGVFLILTESSIAQGVRRIEALTGRAAYKKIRQMHSLIKDITRDYKISEEKIPDFIRDLSKKVRALEKEINIRKLEDFKKNEAQALIQTAFSLEGIRIISKRIDEPVEILREYMDILKEKADKSTVIVCPTATAYAVTVLISMTKDLKDTFDASLSAEEIKKITGGSGGGSRNLAQVGLKDVDKLKLLEDRNNLIKIVKAGNLGRER